MKKIFIGMLFVSLNFNIDLPSSTIGLLPSFIGYYFMLKGIVELAGFSPRFLKIRLVVMAALIYSAIIYVLYLVGANHLATEPRTLVLGLISTVFSLFISYNIIMGIKDIESTTGHNLETAPLYASWWVWAVFSFILYIAFLVPQLIIFLVVIAFFLAIILLYKLHRTYNLFYAQTIEVPGEPVPIGKRAIALIFVALIIGCSGAFVYGRQVIVYRTESICGQLQVTFHRVSGMLTHSSSLSNQSHSRQVNDPVFLWSPCGNYLAINLDDWFPGTRRAEIIDLHGAVRTTPDKRFIQLYHDETWTPSAFIIYDNIQVKEWIDSENLLFNFSWPYDFSDGNHIMMHGWFTWHFPSWTITELVVLYP